MIPFPLRRRASWTVLASAVALAGFLWPTFASAQHAIVNFSISLDFGRDLGNNYGSVFEAYDASGRVVAGAGFLGAVNTRQRSSRRMLSVYINDGLHRSTWERVARLSEDGGGYLNVVAGRLYGRGGFAAADKRPYEWNATSSAWRIAPEEALNMFSVAGKIFHWTPDRMYFDGQPVLQLGPGQGTLLSVYYATGFLVFHRLFRDQPIPNSELVAVPWVAEEGAPVDLSRARIVRANAMTATPSTYGYGHLKRNVVVTLSGGPVYLFDGNTWSTLAEPPPTESYQIYSIANYYDQLLLGHYPSGNLYRFDGNELRQLPGWPPVMPGVQSSARELQSIALYNGELYVGVWPWAELWRYDGRAWAFEARAFSHPAPTQLYEHPYEAETSLFSPQYPGDLWGQRISSLIPFGNALWIATSNKTGAPYDPLFTFLGDGRWRDYGAIYRLVEPGNLATSIEWKRETTQLDFELTETHFSAFQDGTPLGSIELQGAHAPPITQIAWGAGLYGRFPGRIRARSVGVPPGRQPPRVVSALSPRLPAGGEILWRRVPPPSARSRWRVPPPPPISRGEAPTASPIHEPARHFFTACRPTSRRVAGVERL